MMKHPCFNCDYDGISNYRCPNDYDECEAYHIYVDNLDLEIEKMMEENQRSSKKC